MGPNSQRAEPKTPPRLFTSINYFEGGVLVGGMLVPSGEAAGGQGVPDGVVPGVPGVPELPCLFPEVEDEVEGDEPGLEDPALGVELPGMPGIVPQGELLGVVVLGVVVLGSIGDGCVVLPGVGVSEVEPGAVVVGGVVGVAELPGGVTGVSSGVAALPGGVAVLRGGVAVAGVCPAVPGVPADAPPAGVLCATTQIAQKSSTERIVSFLADIGKTSALNFC